MKKKIMFIIILILTISFSGCVETEINNNQDSIVSISKILQHPNRYINTNLTVQGLYSAKYMGVDKEWYYYIQEDEFVFDTISAEIEDKVDTSILIQGGEYYWTGRIVQEGETVRMMVNEINLHKILCQKKIVLIKI